MKSIALILPRALAAAFVICVAGGCMTRDALSLWTDGAEPKRVIVEYVAAVTDEGSPDFIPPERRIAVFDLDGTLFCETDPTYFDWLLFERRVLDDLNNSAPAELTAMARDSRDRRVLPPLEKGRERAVAKAYKGMTLDEFDSLVRRFMEEPQSGYPGMKRGEMFYKPMVQLVGFLVERGFTVYVVSGSDRFLVRALVRDRLPVPPWRVIGSDSAVCARAQGGEDGLKYLFRKDDVPVLEGDSIVKNLQMNKVTAIIREIGVKPVLAFGNSSTDASMANYVVGGNEYRALAFMLLCDDTVRERGDEKKAERMRRSCAENGWIPVSMRDDWKTIYR